MAETKKETKTEAQTQEEDAGAAETVQSQYDLNEPSLYVNRELSLLEFQHRVFEESKDTRNPLLERAKFLGILGSNLDEFFMVRVGGLRMQLDEGVGELSIDGKTPAAQLAEIRKSASDLMEKARCYVASDILPQLNEAGIHVLEYHQLNEKQTETADDYFNDVVFPVLTPLAFDPGHPFPHISNLSLNLAVLICDEDGQKHFARVKVPDSLPHLVPIKRSSGGSRRDGTVPRHHYFVWLYQLIIANLGQLFPGMDVIESYPFHVTRNADFEIQELEAADLMETMEESVRSRRFGTVVRLLVEKGMPRNVKELLAENLNVDRKDIFGLSTMFSLRSLFQLYQIDRYDLKYRSFVPAIPTILKSTPDMPRGSIFSAIRGKDILLHHPYDSFVPVVDFLKAASRDPNVLAIKQTLYRVGSNSPVVKALLEARRDYGKQVAVLVELKARFDEASNITWARMLEQEGVHVVYGLLGLKTHSKVALVVRKEGEAIRRYIHLGTGNYNHITAQIYEDTGMFTCDEAIGADTTDLFNYLTGYSTKSDYRKLLVAPINMRSRLEALIQQEIEHQRSGGNGHLIFKMNSLVDKPIIKLLYIASQVGVKIDLIIRGICALRPGIDGLSENIRVVSVLGRFLEHSRIYYFHNNGDEKVYMGSADLMPRNLNDRVEVLFPVEDQALIRHLRDNVLESYLGDDIKGHRMNADNSYRRLSELDLALEVNVQDWMIEHYNTTRMD
jgi:polyphosphate kinase